MLTSGKNPGTGILKIDSSYKNFYTQFNEMHKKRVTKKGDEMKTENASTKGNSS